MVAWHCVEGDCLAHGKGDNYSQVDRSAEKHTHDNRHPTVTHTVGSTRRRAADGTVTNHLSEET